VFAGEDGLTSMRLATVEQAWMCSPSLYRGPLTLPLSKLADFPLLLQPSGSGLQAMVSRLLQDNGVKAKNVISCNGMVALAKLAESGFGVTCLPKSTFSRELKAGRLQVLKTMPPLPSLEFAAAYRRDSIDNLSSIIAMMAAEVCDFGGQAAKPGQRRQAPA
jgi:DNA-binding transcriptional LysR family regulator